MSTRPAKNEALMGGVVPPQAQEYEEVLQKEEIEEKAALLSGDDVKHTEPPPPSYSPSPCSDNEETTHLADDEESLDKEAEAYLNAEAVAALVLTYPSIAMPGRHTTITRLRYALVGLNLFIPALLEYTGIVHTGPWLTLLALVFAVAGTYQLNHQVHKAEVMEAAERQVKDCLVERRRREGRPPASLEASIEVGRMVVAKNRKVLTVLRMETLSAYVGAGGWLAVCLLWVLVLFVRWPALEESHLAVVGCSAAEAGMCLALGVLMTRYRTRAVREVKSWEHLGEEQEEGAMLVES